MANPKVLMFGWEYAPYYSGGLGIVSRSIVKSLTNQGVDVMFVLPKMPEYLNEDFATFINASKIGIDVKTESTLTEIKIRSTLSPYTNSELYEEFITKIMDVSNNYDDSAANYTELYGATLFNEVDRYAEKAAKIARQNPHDLIHTHDWMTAKAGIVAKAESNNPMIMHVHATEFDRTGGNPSQDVFNIEREGMEESDCIIAVSELTKQKIVEHYGISADKIKVVHNAIDQFENAKRLGQNINQTDKVVLFLGRLTLQKGAEYLLEAAEKVVRHKKRVKFVFVGSGDMLKYLITRSIDLGIEQKVMFTGFMSHEEVDQAYNMADVFVMPSVSEPFGLTALEAVKNGTPVIVSKQSGVSEVVKNMLKVDFWDTDELANQILAVIRYNPLAKFITQNAEQELKKLNWDNQSQKIVEIYRQLSN